jgi:hypothetical protein
MAPQFLPLRFLALSLLFGAALACAEEPARPHVYALVSAIGSELNVVRQRAHVGSNLPPYKRYAVAAPDTSVDAAVLRGLDRAVASEDPESQRVFLRLNPDEVKGVYPYQRGEVLEGKVVQALSTMPERKDWYRIILVTPRFLNVEREGMGPKLHGIGVYIQPLGRNRTALSDGDLIETGIDPDTVSPTGEKGHSYKYVAPYFYAQVWVIDAQSMKVLEINERYDFQRLYDPESTALDVAQQIPPEVLGGLVEKFVERAAARALNDKEGEVIIREPRVVDPSPKK